MNRPLRIAAPDTPLKKRVVPINESHYALKMRQLAKKERRKGKVPANREGNGHPQISDVNAAIMEVIEGEMTASELAPLVSAHLGRIVKPSNVKEKLRGRLLSNKQVAYRHVNERKMLWWKV